MNTIEQYKELTGGCIFGNKTGKEWDFSAIMGAASQETVSASRRYFLSS